MTAIFQLCYNFLFLWIAFTRFIHRIRQATKDGLVPENKIVPGHLSRWMVVLPVLCEAEHLRKSLTCLVSHPECLCDVDIVVALDGKTQEDVNACLFVVQDVLGNYSGSIVARVHCVPTSSTVCGGQQRRKGEAINLVLSLMGKHCVWARIGSKDLLFVNDTIEEREERSTALLQGHREDIRLRAFNIPHSDYLMVVDVDEKVDAVAFMEFRMRVESMPDVTLVQCPKYDFPNSGTISSIAFAANYDSWFHWEAGWIENNGVFSVLGSSYYGSMAAITIEQSGYKEVTTIMLNSGQTLFVNSLFVEGYSIEDYVFYTQKLLRSRTVLLNESIAVGEAPTNLAAWLSLWSRWTCDNVSVFLSVTLPALVDGRIEGMSKRLALLYHGISWFSYPNVALLGLGTIWYATQACSAGAEHIGRLMLFVLVLEAGRRLVPTPRTSILQRASRFLTEVALFPVGMLYVCAGMVKWCLSITVPIATPRGRVGHRPAMWVILSYLVFSVLVFLGSALILFHINKSQQVRMLELASLLFASWFLVGLSLVALSEVNSLVSFKWRSRAGRQQQAQVTGADLMHNTLGEKNHRTVIELAQPWRKSDEMKLAANPAEPQ